LTPSPPPDLMSMPTRQQGLRGGRDHRNPRPASIGTGRRLRSESPAGFIGMRSLRRTDTDQLQLRMPGLTVSDERLLRPFARTTDRERFLEGLRKAGLPET
jgi:hypothetical protein